MRNKCAISSARYKEDLESSKVKANPFAFLFAGYERKWKNYKVRIHVRRGGEKASYSVPRSCGRMHLKKKKQRVSLDALNYFCLLLQWLVGRST